MTTPNLLLCPHHHASIWRRFLPAKSDQRYKEGASWLLLTCSSFFSHLQRLVSDNELMESRVNAFQQAEVTSSGKFVKSGEMGRMER